MLDFWNALVLLHLIIIMIAIFVIVIIFVINVFVIIIITVIMVITASTTASSGWLEIGVNYPWRLHSRPKPPSMPPSHQALSSISSTFPCCIYNCAESISVYARGICICPDSISSMPPSHQALSSTSSTFSCCNWYCTESISVIAHGICICPDSISSMLLSHQALSPLSSTFPCCNCKLWAKSDIYGAWKHKYRLCSKYFAYSRCNDSIFYGCLKTALRNLPSYEK